jgi:hypothetical protein
MRHDVHAALLHTMSDFELSRDSPYKSRGTASLSAPAASQPQPPRTRYFPTGAKQIIGL